MLNWNNKWFWNDSFYFSIEIDRNSWIILFHFTLDYYISRFISCNNNHNKDYGKKFDRCFNCYLYSLSKKMLKTENNASIINAFIDLKLHVFSSLLYWKSKTHLTSCEFIKLYKQGLGSTNSFLMLIPVQKLWTAKTMNSINFDFLK